MQPEHRQIDTRQHRSMLELIHVHVETAAQIMADVAHRRLYQISVHSVPIGWVRAIVDDSPSPC